MQNFYSIHYFFSPCELDFHGLELHRRSPTESQIGQSRTAESGLEERIKRLRPATASAGLRVARHPSVGAPQVRVRRDARLGRRRFAERAKNASVPKTQGRSWRRLPSPTAHSLARTHMHGTQSDCHGACYERLVSEREESETPSVQAAGAQARRGKHPGGEGIQLLEGWRVSTSIMGRGRCRRHAKAT